MQGNLVPAVAENWQTEDNKTWIFTLRENAKWSNGEPITASDFVQSWQTLSQSESPLKIIWLYESEKMRRQYWKKRYLLNP